MERVTGTSPDPSSAVNLGRPGVDSDLTGKIVGDFHILRRLGQGGMGQVYLAKQISLNRQVAFKILNSDLGDNSASLKRFKAEAEAAARASHANIVQVHAIGEQDGLNYMALEYVEGCNLRQYLEKKGPPKISLALSVIRQVAAALQRAAELGIIHRDIKPENILLTRRGEVKVADFGLSRCFSGDAPILNLTQSGVTLGTPLYMSPEQVQGHTLDPRTDIYSLGITCYYMLAGTPPFRGQTAFEVAMHHVQTQPEPLAQIRRDLPPELCAMVDRMMAKKPADRYQTAGDILKDLARLRESLSGGSAGKQAPSISLSEFPIPASTSVKSQSVPAAKKSRLKWAAALTIFTALGGGALFGWRSNQPSALSSKPETSLVESAQGKEVSSQEKWEKILMEDVQKTANPKGDQEQRKEEIKLGLKCRLELGLLYLEQWRLDEADRFYTELISNAYQIGAYTQLGRVGQAIVLAFQDRAEESMKVFLMIFGDKNKPLNGNGPARLALVNRSPRFHLKIAEALDRNAANGQPIPPELRDLRRPERIADPRPPTTKKS